MISKSKSVKLLKEYIEQLKREDTDVKRLRIFDFDDTLVMTDSMVKVTSKNGDLMTLTPAEFARYEIKSGDTFDYSEFDMLIKPRAVKWMIRILKQAYERHGSRSIVILSARTLKKPIRAFLRKIGLDNVEIIALNNPHPNAKVTWTAKRIKAKKLQHVEFFDDSYKNVAAIKNLRKAFPKTVIAARHVIHTHAPTHGFTKHY